MTLMRSRLLYPFCALLVTATTLAGCGSSASEGDPKTLVVASHDSWAMSEEVLAKFKAETGITVKVQPQGDAGQLTNKLVLTKDSPLADGVYGIDNTFASRAVDEDVLAPYAAKELPDSARQYRLEGEAADELTPVDYSDVCVNVDDTWFAKKKLAPPRTIEDLTDPQYKDLFVTPGATTSSPGLAFLVATVAAEGDGWQDYWERLMANGAKVTSGWTDAYEVDFTAGGGKGDRPIVTSYSSSPPFTIPEGETRPTTSALLDTCFRQVEYAGVLKGSDNPEGMEKFIDFMLGEEFQSALPDNMYVYPIDARVELPAAWAQHARTAPEPLTMDADEIDSHRTEWLREWRDITSR
jgi:thiamine transport system substrate-binding protein